MTAPDNDRTDREEVTNPVVQRLAAGQRFTAYEGHKSGWVVGVGPVTDFRGIATVASEDVANWLVGRLAALSGTGGEINRAGEEHLETLMDAAGTLSRLGDRNAASEVRKAAQALAALATHPGEHPDAGEGMKPWEGAEDAPADWNGKPVLLRNGTYDPAPKYWSHSAQNGTTFSAHDVVLYPATPSAPAGGGARREAIARIICGYGPTRRGGLPHGPAAQYQWDRSLEKADEVLAALAQAPSEAGR